jgi:hypothetical protein
MVRAALYAAAPATLSSPAQRAYGKQKPKGLAEASSGHYAAKGNKTSMAKGGSGKHIKPKCKPRGGRS